MDFTRNVQPGHIRQLDIQQHQIKLIHLEHTQRLAAGHRHFYATAEFFQHRARNDDVEFNILHQQDVKCGQWHLFF